MSHDELTDRKNNDRKTPSQIEISLMT